MLCCCRPAVVLAVLRVVLLSCCCRAGRAACRAVCRAAVVLLSCCCRAAVVLLSCCCRAGRAACVCTSEIIQVPVLSLSHPHLEDIPSVSVKALTFDMVLKLQKPLILGGMKSALGHLEKGCSEYFVNVKKQCATEKKKIGRVADSVNANQLEWIRQTLDRVFFADDKLKDQLIIGPLLTPGLLANPDLQAAFAPQFWCAGAHQEVTSFEMHCFGTIRTVNAGSRSIACVNFDQWFSFCRRRDATSAAKVVSKEPSTTAPADKPVMSLAQQNMSVTPLQARKRFRNLSEDS